MVRVTPGFGILLLPAVGRRVAMYRREDRPGKPGETNMSFIQRRLALATLAAALALPGLATAQDRVFFGIATGGTGGTYYPLGGMLAQMISNKVTLGGKKLSATAETSGASVGNAQLLGRKEVESAF